jgi:flagellar FliL protein
MGLYDSKTSNGSDSDSSQRQKIAIGVSILIAIFIGGAYFVYESKISSSDNSKSSTNENNAHEKVDELDRLSKQEEVKNNTVKQDTSVTDKKFENTYLQVDKEFMTSLKDSNKVMVLQIALMTNRGESVFDNFKKHEFAIRSSIMDVIRQTTESEIERPSFRNELTSKIKIVINNVLVKYEDIGGIDDVFFTSFVIK